jgi:cytochrome oxidase Cu insertion factor (SCO1/SenC/PrrC family)
MRCAPFSPTTTSRANSPQLRPVWGHYYVGSDAKDFNPAAAATTPGADQVGHTAIVYLIDPSGKITLFLPGNLDPNDLVADVRTLAAR